MDTTQKNRDSGKSSGQRRRNPLRPAQEGMNRKKTAPRQEEPARRPAAAQNRPPRAPEMPQPQKRSAAAQPQQNRPAQPAPQEEVYRPTPNQSRHKEASSPRRGIPPAAAASAKRSRPAQPTASEADKSPKRRRKVTPPRKNAPAVIYTQPTPFNLHRLLIQLLTVTAVVLALTMGLSIFFKVEYVTVSGAETYSEYRVREASGIQKGDALLTFSRARAAARIRAELPYAERIRFGIKLPNTVIIDIEELDVVYAIQSEDGLYWFITSQGRVVEQTDKSTASTYTQIRGVELQSPAANETAVAAADPANMGTVLMDETTGATGATGATEAPLVIPVTTTNADRLATALRILQALEANDIVGEVTMVDVTNLTDITLDYGGRYDVELGNTDNLEYKIDCMCDVIAQLSEFEMGTLDVSFSLWQDKVEFKPDDG